MEAGEGGVRAVGRGRGRNSGELPDWARGASETHHPRLKVTTSTTTAMVTYPTFVGLMT